MLALLCEQPAHAWSVARQLEPAGELGSIWSRGHSLVYRSIEVLHERELIEITGREDGIRGPKRTIFRASAAGQAAVRQWLQEPVEHVRDGRSLLLLKLVLAERFAVDPRPMLVAQRASTAAALEALERHEPASTRIDELLRRFRAESTSALLRFVDGTLAEPVSVAGSYLSSS